MKRTSFTRPNYEELIKKLKEKNQKKPISKISVKEKSKVVKTTKLTVSQREESILKFFRQKMREKDVTPSEMQKGKSNTAKMSNIAWAIFSNYTRKRDHQKYKGKCYTCNKILDRWQDMSANHYISRSKKITLFDETNVKGGCQQCNHPMMGNGMPRTFAANLDAEYGDGTSRRLYQKSQQTIKADFWWYMEIAEEYIEMI